jgi:PhnB protein
MTGSTETTQQRAVPMLSYEDPAEAIGWLERAFGFRERGKRFVDDHGHVTHAELDLDGARVMLAWTGPDYMAPAHHAQVCEHARKWFEMPYVIDGVLIHVDDVGGHLERSRAAGAEILRGREDSPVGSLYVAADLEGHRWMFLQPG